MHPGDRKCTIGPGSVSTYNVYKHTEEEFVRDDARERQRRTADRTTEGVEAQSRV